MSKRTIIILIILSLLITPFPTKVVPNWKIRIVDTFGNACNNQEVETSWGHYTIHVFGNADNQDRQNTDETGYVEFPTRWIWAPLIWRLIAPVFSFFLTLMHGGGGIYATIDTKNKVDKSKAWISWKPGQSLPDEIVVERCQSDKKF